jgi:hypothetical protein
MNNLLDIAAGVAAGVLIGELGWRTVATIVHHHHRRRTP